VIQWRRDLRGAQNLEINEEQVSEAAKIFGEIHKDNLKLYQAVFPHFEKHINLDKLMSEMETLWKAHPQATKTMQQLVLEFSAFFKSDFIGTTVQKTHPALINVDLLSRSFNQNGTSKTVLSHPANPAASIGSSSTSDNREVPRHTSTGSQERPN
jgi:hypothetical protein